MLCRPKELMGQPCRLVFSSLSVGESRLGMYSIQDTQKQIPPLPPPKKNSSTGSSNQKLQSPPPNLRTLPFRTTELKTWTFVPRCGNNDRRIRLYRPLSFPHHHLNSCYTPFSYPLSPVFTMHMKPPRLSS